SSSGDNEWRWASRLESRCLTASISSSFSFHRRSNSLAASRFRASTASYCSKAFLASYTSCSSLRDRRYIERCRRHSVLRELADWLPPPMARSPLIVLVLRTGLLSCRRSRCNTARHHRSRPCKGSAHGCHGRPNTVHAACAHNVRSAGVRPEDPGQRESTPSIRPPPSSPNCAVSFADSLRRLRSQYNLHDDRG